MKVSNVFIPKVFWIEFPSCPEEIKTMRVRSIALGDTFDSEIQLEQEHVKLSIEDVLLGKEPTPPVYLGDVLSCYYNEKYGRLELRVNMTSTMDYGRWILTELSLSPPPTVTDDTDVSRVIGKQWLLNGIFVNLADESKSGGKLISVHPIFESRITFNEEDRFSIE